MDTPETLRTFSTGATRGSDEGKLDFEGFFSPLALERIAHYMHKNRVQVDGSLRESDNWQKGIPLDAYMKSMYRHFFDVWKGHRGLSTPASIEDNLSALAFNVMGMLHELEKQKRNEPCQTMKWPQPSPLPVKSAWGALNPPSIPSSVNTVQKPFS